MSEPPPRRSSCLAYFIVLALIGALLAGFVFWRLETMSGQVANRVRDVFAEVLHLQPRVTVNDRVVVEQAVSVLELAVVTRDVAVESESEHEWLGSTKRLRVRGVYKVRAGFDLTKPFEVHVDGQKITIEMPPPKILSVDQVHTEVASHENGLWNKVRPEEVGAELRRLPGEALAKARAAGMRAEAVESIRKQFEAKLGKDFDVEVRVRRTIEEPKE
jgi:hypothetical protein